MVDSQLFTAAELGDWLGGRVVSDGRATVVERVVWGWLQDVLADASARPSAVPDRLFSWAIELGAIAHENPAGLSEKSFGDVSEAYSSERRDEILTEVAESDLGNGNAPGDGKAAVPQGSFPDASSYPDPARHQHLGHALPSAWVTW